MNKIELEQEDTLLLKNYLEKKIYNLNSNKTPLARFEFIIRPDCNQTCEYCYLYKYGKNIYPLKSRSDKNTILNNINLLLEYYLKELQLKIYYYDLFAGDLFYDDIFFDIMDIFFKYYLDIKKNQPEYTNFQRVKIVIPTNLSFLENEEKTKRFEDYKNKLATVNCDIIISYSTDGFYAQDTREKKHLTQEWFDKTLAFCGKHEFGVHPMIAPENVDKAIINYDWWLENLNKYFSIDFEWHPMLLPVRNDGWTQEKINLYLEYLNHMIEYRLEIFDRNLLNFTKHITQGQKEKGLLNSPNMDPLRLDFKDKGQTSINCSLGESFAINCMNLEVVPCHRLAYPHLCGGKFKVENNKIIGIEAYENVSSYIALTNENRFYRPNCATCEIRGFCMQGCLGAQYEFSGEAHMPIPSVCNLFKQNIAFLLDKYAELGVLDIMLNPEFENYNENLAQGILTYYKRKEKK